MPRTTAGGTSFNEAAQITARMLIASYFMAAALGSIPAADYGILFASLVPERLAAILGGSVVFTLAVLVLLGAHTRPAALILGLMTFYASYLQMIHVGAIDVLGAFWRDMALIAALMLTYDHSAPMRATPEARLRPARIARLSDRARHTSAPHHPFGGAEPQEPDGPSRGRGAA